MDEKETIRETMRRRRNAVSPASRARASELLAERLLGLDSVRDAACLALYVATPRELDLRPFADAIRDRAVVLAAPRWNGGAYELAEWAGAGASALRQGPRHILEPVPSARRVSPGDVDVWIVPGLAFTRAGARLGYGGGWYDRLLENAAPDSERVGVGYDFQLVGGLPVEPHDSAMTKIVVVPEITVA